MTAKAVKKALLAQMTERGTMQDHYQSLVDDYMAFFKVKEDLIADINTRGVVINYTDSRGNPAQKKNDSVTELVKVNNQMLKILGDLGIRGADIGGEPVDDEL